MTFSDGINALLETYSNCLALLKAFRQSRKESSTADIQHQQSDLRRSLKSDRSLVKRAYSSKLSESGSRFKKGDARAISALDRVLRKLRSAIRDLLRLPGKKETLDLDYESLMSLSNASRVEAIKAIDSLSRRLASPSRSSGFISTSSRTSPSATSPSRHKRRPSPNAEDGPSAKASKGEGSQTSSKKSSPTTKGGEKAASRQQKLAPEKLRKIPQPSSPPSPPPKALGIQPQRQIPRLRSGDSLDPEAAAAHRISIMSFSSDSTKLGQIPQRKLRSVYVGMTDPDGDEYNVRPVFPLKPYTVEVKERRFWGLFGRRREG